MSTVGASVIEKGLLGEGVKTREVQCGDLVINGSFSWQPWKCMKEGGAWSAFCLRRTIRDNTSVSATMSKQNIQIRIEMEPRWC